MESPLTLRSLQQHIRAFDHHPERKLEYLQKLIEEVGELARAMRENVRYADTGHIKGTLDEELYDVLYYVAALANVYEADLDSIVELKEAVNRKKYHREG